MRNQCSGHFTAPDLVNRLSISDWFEDEWTAWRERHERERIADLTEADRSGDPDELVNADEAARILGYSNRDVVHANRRLGYFPDPDAYEPVPACRPAVPAVETLNGMGRRRRPGRPGRQPQAEDREREGKGTSLRERQPVRRGSPAAPGGKRAVHSGPGRIVGLEQAHRRTHPPRRPGVPQEPAGLSSVG
jgi:hypothetical protein